MKRRQAKRLNFGGLPPTRREGRSSSGNGSREAGEQEHEAGAEPGGEAAGDADGGGAGGPRRTRKTRRTGFASPMRRVDAARQHAAGAGTLIRKARAALAEVVAAGPEADDAGRRREGVTWKR